MGTFDWICSRCGHDGREAPTGIHPDTQLCTTCRRHDLGWDVPCRLVRPNPATPWVTFCEQHNVPDDFGHYLDMHPGASTD